MPMTRNQPKNRTETRNRGPEPCSALFSEQAAAFVEGDSATILLLNVEGLTSAKLTIIEQLAYTNTNKVTAILLQETHCQWRNQGPSGWWLAHPESQNGVKKNGVKKKEKVWGR